MNPSDHRDHHSRAEEIDAPRHHRHQGLIVFCEKNLRYEKGFKAWIFLGPYLLGTFVLEIIFTDAATKTYRLAPCVGLIIYSILFPIVWRKFLRFVESLNTRAVTEPRAAGNGLR